MSEVTEILLDWSGRSPSDRGRVVAALYDELRRNAAAHLRKESRGHELQPTVLVNEVYMRLINVSRIDLNGRTHFFGLAGRIMREILVDEARRQRAGKRDHGLKTRLTGDFVGDDVPVTDLLELNDLLVRLEALDPVYVRLVDARVFAGMTINETAALLGLSPATVKRKWKVAVAWLKEYAAADDAPLPGQPQPE